MQESACPCACRPRLSRGRHRCGKLQMDHLGDGIACSVESVHRRTQGPAMKRTGYVLSSIVLPVSVRRTPAPKQAPGFRPMIRSPGPSPPSKGRGPGQAAARRHRRCCGPPWRTIFKAPPRAARVTTKRGHWNPATTVIAGSVRSEFASSEIHWRTPVEAKPPGQKMPMARKRDAARPGRTRG